ncbi:MAG: alpha-ketoglutarate-dependent dioxygenase AlkB [Porticoccaceae bacterium]
MGTRCRYPQANHYIVTRYVDGDHHIGWHYDKPKSIQAGSLITVVKIGAHGRPFQLRDRVFLEKQPGEDEKGFKKRSDKAQAIEKPFFDQTLAPGTAVIMTLEANLLTQHGVPAVDEAGPSGSLVFRTITERVAYHRLKRESTSTARVAKRSRIQNESARPRVGQ